MAKPKKKKTDSDAPDRTGCRTYSNSKGTFLLEQGKLYDVDGKRTAANAVASDHDPLTLNL